MRSLLSRLTGSRAALVLDLHALGLDEHPTLTCAHFLAPVVAWAPDAETPYSNGGIRVHAALAAVAKRAQHPPPDGGDLRAMYAYGRAWMREAGLVAAHLPGELVSFPGALRLGLRAEIPFAFDVATGRGRELVDPEGEDARWYADDEKRARYGVLESEVCLRIDLGGVGMDGEGAYAIVYDYKCVFGVDLSDARAQLALALAAVCSAWNLERGRGVAVHLSADREAVEQAIEFGPAQLANVAWQLEALDAMPISPPPPAKPGPHCAARYCPAAGGGCAATRAVVARAREVVIPAADLVRRQARLFDADATTNDEAAEDLVEIALLEAALEAKKVRTKRAADRLDGIVQMDGTIYSGKEQLTEKPDLAQAGAVEVLEELGLDFAIAQTTSWAAITEVASAKRADEAREALRAIGALKVTAPKVYKARAPKKAAKAERQAS